MTRVMVAIFGTALLASLAGCHGVLTPRDAPQGAYEATVGYAAALKSANAYAALPRCTNAHPPCSDQAQVRKIADAAERAHVAIMALQDTARGTKGDTSDAEQAVAAANRAVFVLASLIPHT
jgi:hypothetical protein